MTKIYNTFGFNPILENDEFELINAQNRGTVKIENNQVVQGTKIIKEICENTDKIFLVNKTVFDWITCSNVCMWEHSTKEQRGTDTIYKDLVFKQ